MFNKFKKLWPIFAICISFILVFLYATLNGNKRFTVSVSENNTEEGDDTKLTNILFTQILPDKGEKWSMDAKEVGFSGKGDIVLFKDFKMNFKSSNGDELRLKGKQGRFIKKEGRIDMEKDIHIWIDVGYELMTDKLLYNQKDGILFTDKNVIIEGPLLRIVGKGLYCDYGRGYLRIGSGVTTYIGKEVFLQ